MTNSNKHLYEVMHKVHAQLAGLDYEQGLKLIKSHFASAYEAYTCEDLQMMAVDSYVKIARRDFTCLESWFCYTRNIIAINADDENTYGRGYWNTLIDDLHHSHGASNGGTLT